MGYCLFSQSISIGPPDLIPTYEGHPVAFKKIDLAVVFSNVHKGIRPLYMAIQKRHGYLNLCQTEDPGLRRFSQFAAVEVKSPDGSYYAASVQLGVWMSAGLERIRQLRDLAASQTDEETESSCPPPYVGIAVTGHVWNVHLASKEVDGRVVSLIHRFPDD